METSTEISAAPNDDDKSDDDSDSDSVEDEPANNEQQNSPLVLHYFVVALFLHSACVALYCLPLFLPSPHNKGQAVLDELHIVSTDNVDVNGNSTLYTIFTNDYWGRPINSASSHKSWRPLTTMSFRYLRGGALLSDIAAHRLFNVVTHACVAELVGILAMKLLPTHTNPSLLRVTATLLWALHPTHVESFVVAGLAGFLCSETFLFQVVPAAVNLLAISYLRRYYQGPSPPLQQHQHLAEPIKSVWPQVLPRLAVIFLMALLYYAGRYYFDTLSIPEGLIRPAENPFYEMVGWQRVRNYLYVLAIHVAKAWDMDFIGFSHEYGRECIRPIDSWLDNRLLIPLAIGVVYTLPLLYFFFARQRVRSPLSIGLIHYVVHLSWMVTLFPVSGFIKVGTFISDRIVVAASVSTCIISANWVSSWVLLQPRNVQRRRQKVFLLVVLGILMWRRIYNRSLDWTDSLPLMESSLKTCPRFAKGHLEISKIYSGLYPSLFNLSQSRFHLEQVESIDPTYCDVHQQFAHVAIQEHKYQEFEERLTKALLCPFTSGGSVAIWQRYWKMVLDPAQTSLERIEASKQRYDNFMKIINRAIEQEGKTEKKQKSSSPLVWGRSS